MGCPNPVRLEVNLLSSFPGRQVDQEYIPMIDYWYKNESMHIRYMFQYSRLPVNPMHLFVRYMFIFRCNEPGTSLINAGTLALYFAGELEPFIQF